MSRYTKKNVLSNQLIVPITCIYFLALASADLLGIGWRGRSSYLFVSVMTSTIGILPVYFFGRCSSFVDLFRNFHSFEQIESIFVGFTLKITF